MPIYEYECSQCAEHFEEIVLGTHKKAPACPQCGAAGVMVPSCACVHMPAPSRVGQTVTFPRSKKSACAGCSGGSCSTCK